MAQICKTILITNLLGRYKSWCNLLRERFRYQAEHQWWQPLDIQLLHGRADTQLSLGDYSSNLVGLVHMLFQTCLSDYHRILCSRVDT